MKFAVLFLQGWGVFQSKYTWSRVFDTSSTPSRVLPVTVNETELI